jgi:hypothetical protein
MSQKCSCGKTYATEAGASMCRINRHGSGKNQYGARHNFYATVEIEAELCCAECSERLSFELVSQGSDLMFRVLPHICPIPEDSDGDEDAA